MLVGYISHPILYLSYILSVEILYSIHLCRPRAGSTTCPHRALTPPRSAGLHKGSGTRRVVASPIMEGLDLASSSERLSQHSVHIRSATSEPL